MLLDFFYALRAANIPVSTTEFLALLGALRARLAFGSLETFYALSRAILVKDEKHYDRFDRVFAAHFNGVSDGLEDLQFILQRVDNLTRGIDAEIASARIKDAGAIR